MDSTQEPQLRSKLIFWLLLSVLSVALAEVTAASAPPAFVNPGEAAFLLTFYGSHLLVFAWLAFRRGWPSLAALWFAGVLFGLYEFYITKVLWSPPWGDTISIGHIDSILFIVLAFFWHPFMAFIFPLAVAEAGGTKSRWVVDQFPTRVSGVLRNRRTWLLLLGMGAAIHGLLTGSPGVAIVSMGSALAAASLTMFWWRRGDRQQRWPLRALLPNERQGRWIAVLLAAHYIMFIPTWTPERMPPLAGHAVVWVLYATFALLLWLALRRTPWTDLGYIVVGAAIDRASGMLFEDALHFEVFEPLGITTAGFAPPPDIWGHKSKLQIGGFTARRGSPAEPGLPRSDNPAVMTPAGRLHLTLADWAKFQRVFLDHGGDFLEPATVEHLLAIPAGKGSGMAMGWAPAAGLAGVSYGMQGSNTLWAATALIDSNFERTAMVVTNSGRSRVPKGSAQLAASILQSDSTP